jgi:polysaccharide export outer membrane protein
VGTTAFGAGRSSASKTAANSSNSHKDIPVLQQRERYVLQPGDVVDLVFPLSPEFNQTLTVAPDGYVSLRGVGDMSVAGKTLPELRVALRTRYLSILHAPVVNVNLRDFQKPFYTVGGQVAHPGKYDLRQDVTVAEALAIAGGMVNGSKSSQVVLFRPVPGGSMVEVRKLNMKKMLKKGDLREDVLLKPGDMLYVPKSVWSNIERFLPTSSVGMYAPGLP